MQQYLQNDNVKMIGGGILFFVVGFLIATVINNYFIKERKLTIVPVEKMRNTHGKNCDFMKTLNKKYHCHNLLKPTPKETYSPFDY